MAAPAGHELEGLRVESLEEDYRRAGLEQWSDHRLVGGVADIVGHPRAGVEDSFVLHAPLELSARARLLPLVEARSRHRARLRIAGIAARYRTYDPIDTASIDDVVIDTASIDDVVIDTEFDDTNAELLRRLCDAVTEGDQTETDRLGRLALRRLPPARLVAALRAFVVPFTAAAAHAPIFFHHLERSERLTRPSPGLLRPMLKALASEPGCRFRWTDEWVASGASDVPGIRSALASAPAERITAHTLIHPIMMEMDESGIATEFLGSVIGQRSDDAARAVLRVAAQSMIDGDTEHAAYGWTHTLTLPQALLAITATTAQAEIGLALAATEVLAFRAAFGNPPLSERRLDDLPAIAALDVATRGACHHDAHVAKYVLACLDAADDDPEAAMLYLAAAAHLLELWAQGEQTPEPDLGRDG